MSHYDYEASQRIALEHFPFYALIMAAMRQADTDNLKLLQEAFPETLKEFKQRYNAPGGLLLSDAPDCPECEGKGGFMTYLGHGDMDSETCTACGGSGKVGS